MDLLFDDPGTENSLKHFGNECNNVEIALSRYDLFINRKLLTPHNN